jgi:RHS repeat-associated protein
VTVTDGVGYVTTYGYDAKGQQTSVIYPGSGSVASRTESSVRTPWGDVGTSTQLNGGVTTFEYNRRRQKTSITVAPASGSGALTSTVEYDDAGNPWRSYDARENARKAVNSAYQRAYTETQVNQIGGAVKTLLPAVNGVQATVTKNFDERDWLKEVIGPDSGPPTVYRYDAAGRQDRITDPLGRSVTTVFNSNGDPDTTTTSLSVADGGPQTQSVGYNSRGEVLSETIQVSAGVVHTVSHPEYDPRGNSKTLTNRRQKDFHSEYYDGDLLKSVSTPLNKTRTWEYNRRRLMSKATEPSTENVSILYDPTGRPSTRTEKKADGTVAFSGSYAYDDTTGIVSYTEAGITVTRKYDFAKRLIEYNNGRGGVLGYGYDENGNLTSLQYSAGRVVTYEYDNRNRLSAVVDWKGRRTTFDYDAAGRMSGINRPNLTRRAIAYNAAGQTTRIEELGADGLPFAFTSLGYDSAGRLKSEAIAPVPVAFVEPTQTLVYNDDNQLTTFAGQSVVHDPDGNMTSGPLNSATAVVHSYNTRNQLTDVAASGAAPALTYGYDSEGNRISVSQGGVTASFVINPASGLPQVLSRTVGGVTTYYVYGAGLLYQFNDADDVLYYHYDYRGSTVATTGMAAQVVDRFEYSTYGRVTKRVGPNSSALIFLFNGRYGVMTDANGLYCMGARYYNPYLRRFLNVDPSGFGGGLNWYAYAGGDPVSQIDPFGLSAVGESDWDLLGNGAVMGTLQAVGGILEAGAGFASGAVGNPFGLLAFAHGMDTAFTGLDRLLGNEEADTLFSRSLQSAGLAAEDAQMVDAGLGMLLTFGCGGGGSGARLATGRGIAGEVTAAGPAFEGALYSPRKLQQLTGYLEGRGVQIMETEGNPSFIARSNGTGTMLLPRNPTALQVSHELSHYLDFRNMGFAAYRDLGRAGREMSVLERLQGNRIWGQLNSAEQSFSIGYATGIK